MSAHILAPPPARFIPGRRLPSGLYLPATGHYPIGGGAGVPNDPAAPVNPAGFSDQAEPDQVDWDIFALAHKQTGVISGCAVTAQGSPDMTVAVAVGSVYVGGGRVSVAAGNVTVTTAHATLPRIDLVVVSSAGTKSVTAGSANANPCLPNVPANSVVLAAIYVPATDTTIDANQITDKRVFLRLTGDDRATTGNLVPNGSFEEMLDTDATLPAAWTLGLVYNTVVSKALTTANYRDGNQAFEMTVAASSGQYDAWSRSIPVRPGDVIRFGGSLMTSATLTTGAYIGVKFAATKDSNSEANGKYAASNVGGATGVWTDYEDFGVVPAGMYWMRAFVAVIAPNAQVTTRFDAVFAMNMGASTDDNNTTVPGTRYPSRLLNLHALSPNLLRNGSFEELFNKYDGDPWGWFFEEGGGSHGTSTAEHVHGDRSFYITASTTNYVAATSLPFPVKPGDILAVSAMVKSDATADGAILRMYTGATRGATTTATDVWSGGTLTTTWTKRQGYVTVPAGHYWATVYLQLYHPSQGTRTAYFDDIFALRTTGIGMGCFAYNSAAQTFTTATTAALALDTELWDDAAFHSTVTNNSRITIPTSWDGRYRIWAGCLWDTNVTGGRTIDVYKNGASWTPRIVVSEGADAAGYKGQNISTEADLVATDYIQLALTQASGGNLTTLANTSWLAIEKVA